MHFNSGKEPLQLKILPFCLNTVSCIGRYMVFLPLSSPFISSSTRLLPHSVTAHAVQSGSRIIPSSWSMENRTQANRAIFPHIICGIHNLPTEFQETEGTVSQEHWNKIRQGTSECFLPYAALMGSKHSCIIHQFFFFFLPVFSWYQHVTANILLWGYKKKNLGRTGKDGITKHFQKYNVLYGIQEQVKEMCCTMLHVETDLHVKRVVSKVKPAYLNAYIINSTTLNKYIQILRRHDVSYESHLMQFCFPVIMQDCERCALQIQQLKESG